MNTTSPSVDPGQRFVTALSGFASVVVRLVVVVVVVVVEVLFVVVLHD